MLLARGAQLNVISRFYGTAVHLAMLDNRPDIVRWCMEKGIAIPPLHMAAYLGDMDAVRSLVRGGADVNQKDVAQFHAVALHRIWKQQRDYAIPDRQRC